MAKKTAAKKSAPAGKKKAAKKKTAGGKAAASKKTGSKKTAQARKKTATAKAKKTAGRSKKSTPTKAAARKKEKKKSAAKKAPAKKAAAKKTAAKKKTQPGKKAAPKAARKKTAPAKKQPAKKKAVTGGPAGQAIRAQQIRETKRPKKKHIPDISRPTGMYGGVMLCDNPKPFPKKSPYVKQELETLKKHLIQERDRLVREISHIDEFTMGGLDRSDEPGRFPTEGSEYSAEMQATETYMGVRSLEEERLEQVVEALERIDTKNNYGLCLACGEKIGIDRLMAKPHAHLCMNCRRLYERKRMGGGLGG